MTIQDCISVIEDVDLQIAKGKSGFDRIGLYILKSTWTNHLVKLIKENNYFENPLIKNQNELLK